MLTIARTAFPSIANRLFLIPLSFSAKSSSFIPPTRTIMDGTSTPPDLRVWLVQQSKSFLEAVKRASLHGWVLCIGNEAGDLDTLACSIAFAYLSTFSVPNSPFKYCPLQLTPSEGFNLRPENMEALRCADLLDDNLSAPMSELICSDSLDLSKLTPMGAKYALLDHNELKSSVFGSDAQVVSVIDHHEPVMNNTLYPDAKPRLIQVPTGSCASLVVNYFAPLWSYQSFPTSLADLLLSAISIDTSNFKPIEAGGKATHSDVLAKQWLLARSRFYLSTIPESPTEASMETPGSLDSQLGQFHKHLSDLKNDVSGLTSVQLLQRDYKDYQVNGWKLGLATVPLQMDEWVKGKSSGDWINLLSSVEKYRHSNGLDVIGILTSYKLKKKVAAERDQPRHGRELMIMLNDPRLSQLFHQLEQKGSHSSPESIPLQLESLVTDQQSKIQEWAVATGCQVRIWHLSRAATRKQVAPILSSILASSEHK